MPTRFSRYCRLTAPLIAAMLALTAHAKAEEETTETVTVAAERGQLVGQAITSSQGQVAEQELRLVPAYRPGQILETVPGLVVATHSGEGKANQFLLRGVNLDHGTDLASFVDGMPINEPSHAHGQGYTDLNFLIPELVGGIDFTKGPYFAAVGDFGAVGSVRIALPDNFPSLAKVIAGPFGFARMLAAGPVMQTGSGALEGALELQHYDGPWTSPDDQRKYNAVLRYSQGDQVQGWSLTAMGYGSLWNATTDQPVRAMTDQLIGRFGTLNPTDGGMAQRYSLSGQYHAQLEMGDLNANAYIIGNRLTLWNDFTHFLNDPVNGDQEAQEERRFTMGGGVSDTLRHDIFGLENEWTTGLQLRFDNNHLTRDQTKARAILSTTEDDTVNLGDAAIYAQDTLRWTGWLRSVLGIREDFQAGGVGGTNPGNASKALFQPKGSLIFGPWANTEFYVSAGEGYHSDDLRGVTQARTAATAGAPFLARQSGEEIGVRTNPLPDLTATLTLFKLDSQSETTYDPDIGEDSAGPGSKRLGVEFNATYQAADWLEFYGTFAATHARYNTDYDDGTGHTGTFIPNAPSIIASFNAYVSGLGRWSGGIGYRYLGEFPLTPDDQKHAPGYGEWNADINYALDNGWSMGAGLYNILDTHANAEEFWYADRLPGEPASGVVDVHVHPLEPFTVRFTITKTFDQ